MSLVSWIDFLIDLCSRFNKGSKSKLGAAAATDVIVKNKSGMSSHFFHVCNTIL